MNNPCSLTFSLHPPLSEWCLYIEFSLFTWIFCTKLFPKFILKYPHQSIDILNEVSLAINITTDFSLQCLLLAVATSQDAVIIVILRTYCVPTMYQVLCPHDFFPHNHTDRFLYHYLMDKETKVRRSQAIAQGPNIVNGLDSKLDLTLKFFGWSELLLCFNDWTLKGGLRKTKN